MKRPCWIIGLMMLLTVSRVEAQEPPVNELQRGFANMAEEIAELLMKQSRKPEIRIGAIVRKPEDRSRSECLPGLVQELESQLRLRVSVTNDAVNVFQASFAFLKRDPNGLALWEFDAEVQIQGKANPVKLSTTIRTRDNRVLPQLVAATAQLDQDQSAEMRNQSLYDGVVDPKVYLHNSNQRISTNRDSPYWLEIWAGQQGKLKIRAATAQDGKAFVNLDPDEEYILKIYQMQPNEVAVQATIDGIDVFAFSDMKTSKGRPQFSHWLLPPAQGGKPGLLEIKGWHKNEKTLKAFKISELGFGAASLLNNRGEIGQISLRFSHCYIEGDIRAKGRGSVETGFGRDLQQPQKPVARKIDVVHECLTVRYNRTGKN